MQSGFGIVNSTAEMKKALAGRHLNGNTRQVLEKEILQSDSGYGCSFQAPSSSTARWHQFTKQLIRDVSCAVCAEDCLLAPVMKCVESSATNVFINFQVSRSD
mmetsp:Transcript_8135/g.15001  ORF Transcript_8135/g.15001 Transcript_8135/m.15001 type:complete len:103 (-) Transcript_8135:520-828(-)